MTPEEVGERMIALLADDTAEAGEVTAGVSGGGPGHERAVVDVPAARWWAAIAAARDPGALGCDFFDWLSAVDELDEGFTVVAHLWSSRRRHGVLIRARVPRTDPVIESVVDLFPGAAWHERETFEMFGVAFSRHPDLRPLLLPPAFEGHPLRKEFVLASRVAKAWPGAKEPGESEAPAAAKRAPMRPPGVPDPNEWGPLKGKVPPPETPARRAAGERPARPAGERPARPAGEHPPRRPASDSSAAPLASPEPPDRHGAGNGQPGTLDRPGAGKEEPGTPDRPGAGDARPGTLGHPGAGNEQPGTPGPADGEGD